MVLFLREADAGMAVKNPCRRHGFSAVSYDLWRSKFGGMRMSIARRLKALEAENTRLKKLKLVRWAKRKYKTLSQHKLRSADWITTVKDAYPQLFFHWRVAGHQVG